MPTSSDAQHVIREVELAIHEHNYGRLYDLGINLVKKAANENSWLEAVVIITGYLVKSQPHLWDAVDLSKRAALQAPENSRLEDLTHKSLVVCINAFPDAEDRIKASYSVVSVAPKSGNLIALCLDLMLENIPQVEIPSARKQYIKMVIYYSPKGSPAIKRAEILMIKTHAEIQEKLKVDEVKEKPESQLGGFLDRYQGAFEGLYPKDDLKKEEVKKPEKVLKVVNDHYQSSVDGLYHKKEKK